jgi:hypothetical protein
LRLRSGESRHATLPQDYWRGPDPEEAAEFAEAAAFRMVFPELIGRANRR